MPSNLTPETATPIVFAGGVFTQTLDTSAAPTGTGFPPSCNGDNQYYAVWWKYTAVAGDVAIAFTAASDDHTYEPAIDVWVGTPPSLSEYSPIVSESADPLCFFTDAIFPRHMPVTPGTTYYFQVTGNDPATPTQPLVLTVKVNPASISPAGAILVLNDVGGWPAWTLDPTTGALLRAFALPATEQAAFLPSGVLGTWVENPSTNKVASFQVWDATLGTIVATVTSFVVANQDPIAPITVRSGVFYVCVSDGGTTAPTVYTVSAGGVVGGTSWTLPANAKGMQAMAVSVDGNTLYYVNHSTGAVHRYDLTNSTPLSDFLGSSSASYEDLIVTASGDVVLWKGGAPASTVIKRYNSSAVLQATSSTFGDTQSPPRMTLASDTTLLVMSFPGSPTSRFSYLALSSLAVTTTFDVTQNDPPGGIESIFFGPSQSCPVLVLPVEVDAGGGGGGGGDAEAAIDTAHSSSHFAASCYGWAPRVLRFTGTGLTVNPTVTATAPGGRTFPVAILSSTTTRLVLELAMPIAGDWTITIQGTTHTVTVP